jgi:beta propeller repeat protein
MRTLTRMHYRRLGRVVAVAIVLAATLVMAGTPRKTATAADLPYRLEPAMTSSVGAGQRGLVADRQVAVWQDARSGTPDIFAYDLQDDREFRPARSEGHRTQPAISGSTIVWVAGAAPEERTIEGINLNDGSPIEVTGEAGKVTDPVIFGDTVIWREYRDEQWSIVGKDLGTDRAIRVSGSAAKNPSYPSISGSTVVWQDYRNGNWDIYLADLKNDRVRAVTETPDNETRLVIDGSKVVFCRTPTNGGSHQLVLYDLETQSEKVLASDHVVTHAAIAHGIVTWEDWRSGLPDVYAYDIAHDALYAIARSQQAYDPAITENGIAWISRSSVSNNRIQALAMIPRLPTDPQSPPAVPSPDRIYIPETKHSMTAGFKAFWQSNDGAGLLGYPLSEEFAEKDPITGEDIVVQYFERVKLEYRPSAPEGQRITLGRLGAELTEDRNFKPIDPFPNSSDQLYFPETGHSLSFAFKDFWEANGGLAMFGFPISEEFTENGKTVQYFERARFEFNPGGQDVQSKVALGLLGREALQHMGWLPAPPIDTTHLAE